MRSLDFEPLARPMSRFILGTGYEPEEYHRLPRMLDRYVEVGGNAVDTARWYGEGERTIGAWRNANRDVPLIVITKGAHPDVTYQVARVRPDAILADLAESLAELDLEAIDIYLLHRDDPRVPVGEILSVLNEARAAGRVRSFGASNWTTARLDEAITWAEANGVASFQCSSPNLSLARPVWPPWPGCISAGDEASLRWYQERRLPVIAWSAVAGGFFARAGRAGSGDEADAAYRSDANVERRRRAVALGRRLGPSATQIALAWVLEQPFPTFAVVGARSAHEIDACAAATEMTLDAADLAWLNLRS